MAATLLAASLASCGGSDLTAPVAHTWQLQTVKDQPIPAAIANSSPETIVTSGTMITNTNGTYTLSLNGSSNGANGSVASDNGSWSITSSTFIFHSNNGSVPDYIAALNSGTIRVAIPGALVHSSDASVDMVFAVVP